MNLMRYQKLFFTISLFFLIPGFLSLVFVGLKPAIDFTGGSLLELQFADQENGLSQEQVVEIREILSKEYEFSVVQSAGADQLVLKGKELDNQRKDQLIADLTALYGQIGILRFETVGPILGKELIQKTITAVLLVATVITLYVWKQFKDFKYGVCAILAMLHDSLFLLGSFSLLGFFFGVEVDLLFVTALLTTMSFSIHDTIVVYDRIRELSHKNPRASFMQIANEAVVVTLSRSINNSMTIIIMLLSLVVMGGETIRYFAVALLLGAITGTYSSTFTAVPLLLLFSEQKKN